MLKIIFYQLMIANTIIDLSIIVFAITNTSKFFWYNFDNVLLKKGAYSPIAHDILNAEQAALRNSLIELLFGDRVIRNGENVIKIELSEQK